MLTIPRTGDYVIDHKGHLGACTLQHGQEFCIRWTNGMQGSFTLEKATASRVCTIDRFTRAYIECALWSSMDSDEPLDKNHDIEDIAPGTLAAMVADCEKFQTDNAETFEKLGIDNMAGRTQLLVSARRKTLVSLRAGHDFWLTRNHHGAGFWDGDWRKDIGDKLTEASRAYPEVCLYVGDDGKIYA